MITTANLALLQAWPLQLHNQTASLFGAFVSDLCKVFAKGHPALAAAVSELNTPISPDAVADVKVRLTPFDVRDGLALVGMLHGWCVQERYANCAIVPGFQVILGRTPLFVRSPESHCEAFLFDLAAAFPAKRPAIDIAVSLLAQDIPADTFSDCLEQLTDDQIRVVLAFLRLIGWWQFA